MRQAIQRALMALVALLEKEEPPKPCVCISDVGDSHWSDCTVGPRRDARLRYEEAAWVRERLHALIDEYGGTDVLDELDELICDRWSHR